MITTLLAPQGRLTVGHSDTRSDRLTFIWQTLDCEMLLGVLQRYDVLLYVDDKLDQNTTTTNRNFTVRI